MRAHSVALAVVLALALAVVGCGGGGGGAPPVPFTAANLSGLSVSAGALSPAFSPGTTSYTARVPTVQTSLTVTPTALESGATMTVNGTAVDSGTASGDIALAMGPSDVTIVVTGSDGITQKTYVIQVIRGEQDADLADLAISAGTLSPAFSPATTFYTVRVPSAQASVTVTPTASDPAATITINGAAAASGVPSSPIALSVGPNTITILVTATDTITQKAYTIAALRPGQEAYLKASNTDGGDWFGCVVAISGDTIVVGAEHEWSNATGVDGDQSDNSAGNSGAAYVFVRTGGVWSQQAYLKASNTDGGDQFGCAVAVDGDTIVVGALNDETGGSGSGAAYVFTRTGAVWSQQALLKASNATSGDFFGTAVAIDGDTIVVGAELEDNSATGVDGIGVEEGAHNSGAAYVFVRNGSVWSQQAYLKASNTGANDSFGYSVAVSGDTVAVSTLYEDSCATGVNGTEDDDSAVDAGAAYVFTRTGGVWSQQAYLKASNTDAADQFGISVAIDGDTVVVGANNEYSNATGVNGNQTDNSTIGAGAAYVFTRTGGVWSQQAYLKASNTDVCDYFGWPVAIDGDAIVVGASWESSAATGIDGNQADNTMTQSGAAFLFVRSGGAWSQEAYLKASNTESGDFFGNSVAVDGGTIVVGAYVEDSAATGVNGNQTDNSAADSGAAYVFR